MESVGVIWTGEISGSHTGLIDGKETVALAFVSLPIHLVGFGLILGRAGPRGR